MSAECRLVPWAGCCRLWVRVPLLHLVWPCPCARSVSRSEVTRAPCLRLGWSTDPGPTLGAQLCFRAPFLGDARGSALPRSDRWPFWLFCSPLSDHFIRGLGPTRPALRRGLHGGRCFKPAKGGPCEKRPSGFSREVGPHPLTRGNGPEKTPVPWS